MKSAQEIKVAAWSTRSAWRLALGSMVFAAVAWQATPSVSVPIICQPVTASSFEFLKQPPFVKTGWTVGTQGIEDSCQVDIVKASLFRILATAVHRRLGPPFEERWVREGWASESAFLQMNGDESTVIPLRKNSERYTIGKRLGYSRILRWEFLSAEELIVDISYQDSPHPAQFIQRVRYKSMQGKSWYLDGIVK